MIGGRRFSQCTPVLWNDPYRGVPLSAPTSQFSGWYPKSLSLLLTLLPPRWRPLPFLLFFPLVARSWHRVGGFISAGENAYSPLSLFLSLSRSVPWSPRSSCLFRRFPRQRFLDSDFSTLVMVVRGLLRRFFPSTSGGFMRRQEGRLGETCTRFENRAPDNSCLICRYTSRRRLCPLLHRVIEGYLIGSRCL